MRLQVLFLLACGLICLTYGYIIPQNNEVDDNNEISEHSENEGTVIVSWIDWIKYWVFHWFIVDSKIVANNIIQKSDGSGIVAPVKNQRQRSRATRPGAGQRVSRDRR